MAIGSSPLARGLRVEEQCRKCLLRIIPARAGFTCVKTHDAQHTKDHPRSRGVYYRAAYFVLNPLGSSPLARGLRHSPYPDPYSYGIIPARAGFTGYASGGVLPG